MLGRLLTLALLVSPVLHATTPADAPESWGAAVPSVQARPLDAALAAFDPAAEATPGVFQGRIVDVCAKRGCWAVLEADGTSARVMPREHDFMIPRDVRGEAMVYGTLSRADLSAEHAEFAATNPGKPNPVPEFEYRIEALGVALVE